MWENLLYLVEMKANDAPKANVGLVDYGKSPALNVRLARTALFGDNAIQQADQWFAALPKPLSIETGSLSIIPPGIPTSDKQQIAFITAESDRPLSQSDIDHITQTDHAAVVVARIEYYDLEGNLYWSDICQFRLATGAIASCHTHNEMH
ncbi:MAG: hypothetical protein DMF72_17880 [Acidobacteria bacterium]|nr:MAG: hypothetical protein DMF72_17880 [Acidobacteriota bacterium]